MLDFYNIFIEKHGIPNDEIFLQEYIEFVLTNRIEDKFDEYCEYHHILPRSIFPEYVNNVDNIVLLKYKDHVLAHEILFKAYNLRVYQRPLNYFNSNYLSDEKTHERVSNAAKKGWETLKNNEEKYNKWRKNRSECMSSLPSEEQSRRITKFWESISDKERKEFGDKMKLLWTDEKRKEWAKQVSKRYDDEEYRKKISNRLRERYNNQEFKSRFVDKMNEVNKDESKRKAAGESIKNKWKDADYLEKMKNRPARSKHIEIIQENGEILKFNRMIDCCKYYNISMHILRKFIKKEHLENIPDVLKNANISVSYGKSC